MNRPDDPISCEPGKMRDGDHSSLVVRFVAGAAASVLARLVALTAGPVVSGAFLAFPAILAASLALVAKEEQRDEAREDAGLRCPRSRGSPWACSAISPRASSSRSPGSSRPSASTS